MAAYEVLLLNTAVPQIQAAQSGDTYVVPRDIAFSAALTLSAGTANGVPYLNGSKVLTTGSALQFDGTNLGVGITPAYALDVQTTAGRFQVQNYGAGSVLLNSNGAMAYKAATTGHQFFNASSQAMTLDASGNLGIGTTNPQARLEIAQSADNTDGPKLRIANNGNTLSNGQLIGGIDFFDGDDSGEGVGAYIYSYTTDSIGQAGGQDLRFAAGTTERARITSGGYFKASNNGTYNDAAGAYHELRQTADGAALRLSSTNASLTNVVQVIAVDRNTTNNTFYALSYYNSGAAAFKLLIADSGDVTNTNGTYGTISDAKMKTDIVDAGSQWSDIKALRFRKFKMKNDPSGLVQLGVVAQEVELTSPGLVDEHADKDAEGNDLGTTTKSVKTSVLLMKAAVALQEAMARIEQLEAKVAAMGA